MTDLEGTDRDAFFGALADVDDLLRIDRKEAVRLFGKALAMLSPADLKFYQGVADQMGRMPWKIATRHVAARARRDPSVADLAEWTAPSDPSLYLPESDPVDVHHVPVDAAEWVRQSIRERRDRERVAAVPTAATDAVRLSPEARARRARYGLRHRGRDARARRAQRAADALYGAYAAERAFRIDGPDEEDRTPPVQCPRKPEHLMWGHVGDRLWDRSYVLYVAEQLDERSRDVLDPPRRTARSSAETTLGSDAALEDETTAYLRQHAPELDEQPRTTASRGSRRPRRSRLTATEQMRWAKNRTGIPVPSDYDELVPYTQQDVPELPWDTAGSGGLDTDVELAHRGWPCVVCWMERCVADRRYAHRVAGRWRSDDGLCAECRADGHAGVAALPVPWTAAQFHESRCAYIAEHYPAHARALLDRIRRDTAGSAGPVWRIITRWMAIHIDDEPHTPYAERSTRRRSGARRPRRVGPGQRLRACDGCGQTGIVWADGYCGPCRVWLGLMPAADPAA
ncbi:hypothetical protein [Nocardia puris]|uniref:hypothetical protein n=1 Tax=Nocardia puris TaxID=208602 RepID=UPI002E219905